MKKILYIALCAFLAFAFTAQISSANPYAVCKHSRNPKRCYYRIKDQLAHKDRRREKKIVKKIIRHDHKKATNSEIRRIERRAHEVHKDNQRRRKIQSGTAKTVKIINGVKYIQYYDRYGKLRLKIKPK